MIQLAVCTAVRQFLAGAQGVNAQLAALPRLPGHEAAPRVEHIADPFSDKACAQWKEPARYPALYVMPDGPVDAEGEVATRYREIASCAVGVRYLVREGDEDRSARHAAYTLEAIARSLRLLMADDETGRAARTVGQFYIKQANAMTYGPWREAVGASVAVAVFAVDFAVRNNQP